MSETEIQAAPAAVVAPVAIATAPAKPAEFWFARRFEPGDPRNGMGPVNWKGWVAFAAFVGALLFAALIFLVLAIAGGVLLGIVVFGAFGGGALFALTKLVHRKGDTSKTMEDYVKAKGHVVG
jgi:hypothetical protein